MLIDKLQPSEQFKELQISRDPEGKIIDANATFFTLLRQLRRDFSGLRDIEGLSTAEVISPHRASILERLDNRIKATYTAASYFYHYKHKKHTVFVEIIQQPQLKGGRIDFINTIGRYLNVFQISNQIVFLSPRELDVFCHLTFGLPVKIISRNLGINSSTVTTYIKRIREKLHITSQTDLLSLVAEHNICKNLFDYIQRKFQIPLL